MSVMSTAIFVKRIDRKFYIRECDVEQVYSLDDLDIIDVMRSEGCAVRLTHEWALIEADKLAAQSVPKMAIVEL